MTGCGRYLRLLWQSSQASDTRQVWYFANLAREHQETCDECQRMKPLEEQLFKGKKVVVT